MACTSTFTLEFLLYFPIRTQLRCLAVCSAEVSHTHKTGLFFIPVSTYILLLNLREQNSRTVGKGLPILTQERDLTLKPQMRGKAQSHTPKVGVEFISLN